jgi:glycosyltransferase involved in cell wall biosynthesis
MEDASFSFAGLRSSSLTSINADQHFDKFVRNAIFKKLLVMKIVLLTTDNREHYKTYSGPVPLFGTAPEALLQGFASIPESEVHVVSCTRQPVPAPAKLASNIYFHSLLVPRIGWIRTGFQGCIRASRKKIRDIQPQIVHGQGTESDCSISAVFSGFPNVLTIHGNMRLIAKVNQAQAFSYPWLAARLERFTIPRSQGVVCITRYTKEAVAGIARRTWVVPNAVDQAFFEINAQSQTDVPRILCVGHVCHRKNQNAFIRSLDTLAKKRQFELVFLGVANPGDLYAEEFRQLVAARSWCRYLGVSNRDQLRGHFQEASLLALPSLEDNCPMVVLEAMAAQVPVVAANVGGVPDLVEAGKTGFLCDPLNPQSMMEATENALNLPFARELARQAKSSALERFHPRVVARRHLEIYREVLSRPS